jgi:Cu2+-exporting ATPase
VNALARDALATRDRLAPLDAQALAPPPATAPIAVPAADARCAHCDEPLPADRAGVDGAGGARFCCNGCAAAAAWIGDAGLADYYRLRSVPGNRVEQVPGDYAAWDRADVQRGHVLAAGDAHEIHLALEGMRCAACAWLVDRALSREDGVREASANAITGRLRLRWDPARTPLSRLLARLDALGYRPFLAGGEALERARRRERNALLLRLGVAALAATQAMMFSEAAYLDSAHAMAPATRDFFRWLTLLACTPVVFYSGMPFLSGMRRELALRRPGMDTLAGASILLAYLASVVETLRGGPQVWFDAAAMFVLFLLAARVLERSARLRAGARLDLLARATPALAWRRRDGLLAQVPASELAIGDEVQVGADCAVPADGRLLDAAGAFDEALLTGESTPCDKRAGDAVHAGSIALLRPVRIAVTGVGAQTRLAQVQRLVERAQGERPALAALADRLAHRFVLAMFAASVLAFAAWWPQGGERAFAVALAVLVAACPCALALAVPATRSAAMDALARRGVLVLGGDALERLAGVDTVVLDKTGTLTEGRPVLQRIDVLDAAWSRTEVLAIAAALERDNHHPIAAAFADAQADMPGAPRATSEPHVRPAPRGDHGGDGGGDAGVALHTLQLVPGRGVAAVDAAGHAWRLGHAAFATGIEGAGGAGQGGAGGADDGAVWLGCDGMAVARFVLADRLRDDAGATLARLHALGLRLVLASGDGHEAVAHAAGQLGLGAGDVHARLDPDGKLALVRGLQARGRRVVAVGDGINDAPVLAGADVSVALGAGSALAQRSAGLLLLGARLGPLADAIVLARATRAVLRQNLAWAVGYNLVAIAVAASGLVHPGWAALGMAGSSLGVTLNALRVGRRA